MGVKLLLIGAAILAVLFVLGAQNYNILMQAILDDERD